MDNRFAPIPMDKVTVDALLALAVQAEQEGNTHLQYDATTAAQWMEEKGLTETTQVAHFGGKPIRKGQKVRVKKGSRILSMHPKFTRENPKVAGRDYIVTVYDVHNGWLGHSWHPHEIDRAVQNQQIVWPGEGSYWCYLDAGQVELVD
jgi:hypothetical protein